LGPLDGGFGHINDCHLPSRGILVKLFLARQSKLARFHQQGFDLAHNATDSGFAETPVLRDMKLGAVLAPIFKSDEELVFDTEFRLAASFALTL
jgi:hypothetical protein